MRENSIRMVNRKSQTGNIALNWPLWEESVKEWKSADSKENKML